MVGMSMVLCQNCKRIKPIKFTTYYRGKCVCVDCKRRMQREGKKWKDIGFGFLLWGYEKSFRLVHDH